MGETNASTVITTLTASGWHPTRATLAARSLAAVDRITDPVERRAAFTRHMDRFPPAILRAGRH